MSTLRISNIEAKSVPASATVDEKVKITNSSGDTLVFIDGKTSGITTVGINTTDSNITFDANSNVVVTGIITATKFSGQFEPTNLTVSGVTTIAHTGANQLIIKDSDTSGDNARMRISFQDSGGTEKFFVGNNTTNGWLYLGSPSGQNNNIAFRVNGNDKFQVNGSGAYVNGALTVAGNADIADSIIHTGDTNTKIRFPAADTITAETGGSERLRIRSDGAIVIPNGTLGLRMGGTVNAGTEDFAIFHSGSNSHIEHFGTGDLHLDFNNDFNLRFFRTSPTDVREALTIVNGVAANPEFIIKSNPTSASVNSGTHAPLVKFKGAGWNTNSGSVEVGTQLQSEHYYWSGSYSNTFGQTYPDFKIKMKNSDSNSYVEKFAFSGDGKMRLQSGGGINFHNYGSGTGVASNTLDDYEEGSWTCVLSGSSGGSVNASRACYTKIGNMVMCEATFVNPGNNSVSGNWTMSLPFQFIGGGTGAYGGGKVTYTRYVPALTGGFQSYTIFSYYGQGVCYLYKLGTNGSSESQWIGGSVNNSLLFSFTMSYTTA